MEYYGTKKRFCPHLLVTRIHAVETYRETKDIDYVCRKYHISKGAFTFRITDIYGQVIIDEDIPLCEDDSVIVPGHV